MNGFCLLRCGLIVQGSSQGSGGGSCLVSFGWVRAPSICIEDPGIILPLSRMLAFYRLQSHLPSRAVYGAYAQLLDGPCLGCLAKACVMRPAMRYAMNRSISGPSLSNGEDPSTPWADLT